MNPTIPIEEESQALDAETRVALIAEIADAIREQLSEQAEQELRERIRTGLFR